MKNSSVETYLKEGKIAVYPAKRSNKLLVLEYLASKFEMEKIYTEKEVNDLLWEWHTFQDPAMLRREMFDFGYLGRERDGSRYWKVDKTN